MGDDGPDRRPLARAARRERCRHRPVPPHHGRRRARGARRRPRDRHRRRGAIAPRDARARSRASCRSRPTGRRSASPPKSSRCAGRVDDCLSVAARLTHPRADATLRADRVRHGRSTWRRESTRRFRRIASMSGIAAFVRRARCPCARLRSSRRRRRHAQDTLKIAAGQRGNWDTSISEVGQRAGIFKKHGLVLEILWTQGGGETQQAVISGSVDIGVAAGHHGRAVRILEGRAGAHHRRRDDRRRRPLLVRAGRARRSSRSRTPTARRSPTRPTARRRTASSPRS